MKLTAVIAFLSLGAFYFGLSLAYLSSVSQPTL